MTRFLILLTTLKYFIYLIDAQQLYDWFALDYQWNVQHTKDDYANCATEKKCYKPANNIPTGIKVDKHGNIYVTVPRWLEGVPSTLNRVGANITDYGILIPWPSWEIQTIGDANSLQNVQSMAITNNGSMWVIEVGRRNFFSDDPNAVVNGQPGVWIIDISTQEIISKYYFPNDIVTSNNSFLNDIVVDEKRQIAYLSDAWGDGGIIVYNYLDRTSRRFAGESTKFKPDYVWIVNGFNYGPDAFKTPVDGIAITDDFEAIFYCSLQGIQLFRLQTSLLRNFDSFNSTVIEKSAQMLGIKEPSDGIIYWNGVLYWGSLTESTYYALAVSATSVPSTLADGRFSDAVAVWPSEFQSNQRWPDTFAIDLSDPTRLLFVSNGLDLFFNDKMNFILDLSKPWKSPNFYVQRVTATNMGFAADSCNDNESYIQATIALAIIAGICIIVVLGFLYTSYMSKSKPEDKKSLFSDQKMMSG